MAEKQSVIRIGENRIVKRQQLSKPGFFIRDMANFEAFFYLKDYLQQFRMLSKSTYWLPIYERFAMPVSPYRCYTDETLTNLINLDKICQEAFSLSSMQTDAQQRKQKFGDYMAICVMGIVVLLIIVVLLAASGKINLGALFGGG